MRKSPDLLKAAKDPPIEVLESRKLPSGNLKFNRVKATGLMFDPSTLIPMPPSFPLIPPNMRPRAAGDLSSVSGGEFKLAAHATRAWPAAIPFT